MNSPGDTDEDERREIVDAVDDGPHTEAIDNVDRAVHGEVIETVVNRPASFNMVFYDVLSTCAELRFGFPSDAVYAAYMQDQEASSIKAAQMYTQASFDHPELAPAENGNDRVSEAWVFASCMAQKRRDPANNLEYRHYFGRVINSYVAKSVLGHLGQPLLLNADADFFQDVDFWRDNLALNPVAFQYLPYTLRNNLLIASEAIPRQPDMFMFGGDAVRSNLELATLAVRRDGHLLLYCSMRLRVNLKIITLAIRQNFEAATHLTRDVLLSASMLNRLGDLCRLKLRHLPPAALRDPDIIATCRQSFIYERRCLPDDVEKKLDEAEVRLFRLDNTAPPFDRTHFLATPIWEMRDQYELAEFQHAIPILRGGPERTNA